MNDLIKPAIDALDDTSKLRLIVELTKSLQPQFKQLVINELAESNSAAGEAVITISSNEQMVRVQFDKSLAWFVLPRANAVALGLQLMQHGGANIEAVPGEKPRG